MKPKEFIYWLRGYAAASDYHPSAAQWEEITDVLNKVELGENQLAGNRSIHLSGIMTGSVSYGTPSVYVTHTGGSTAMNVVIGSAKQLLKTEPNN